MASLAGDALFGLFTYNKQNYRYDRELRQKMEYQLVDMRIQQANLWRDDVRTIVGLTLTKMEAYLLVIALELGCCVTALCKGRVPPGAPSWLAACHTLSLAGAFTYLFMALWLGLHAYVAAQAYKVRILTHFVRLPIPHWQTIEAGRTYESSFEKMKPSQMLRVPFMMGAQESLAARSMPQARPSSAPSTPRGPLPSQPPARGQAASRVTFGGASFVGGEGGEAPGQSKATDPWGLERPGDDIPELQPDANEKVEKQRHVYRCRSAAQFYETYDAFCRISMSTGTCSFATFLCYYCLTYVLTENASPVAAWTGMLAYIAIALVLLRLDMKLKGAEFFWLASLMIAPAVICGAVTFVNSKGRGRAGDMEWLMPFVPFLHGCWYAYYLSKFQVRELEGGAVLPAAFGSVLYLDSFGWSKLHMPRRAPRSPAAPPPLVRPSVLQNFSGVLFAQEYAEAAVSSGLPSMNVLNSSAPRRPEDTAPQQAYNAAADNVSFRASTFSMTSQASRDGDGEEEIGSDIVGDKPGSIPWQTYRWSTIMIMALWFTASVANVYSLIRGDEDYVWLQSKFADLKDGEVRRGSLEALQYSGKVNTKFVSLMTRPRGLSCDQQGQFFVTSGLDSDGQESLLQGQLASAGADFLNFEARPRCIGSEDIVEDVTLHRCGDSECDALLLPRQGERLVPCRLPAGSVAARGGEAEIQASLAQESSASSSMVLPMHLAWLDDRGGAPLGSSPFEDADVDPYGHPEEISAVASIPCDASSPAERCLVVGTTARRIVQLAAKQLSSSTGPVWLPRRILVNDVGEVPGPGAFALIGDSHLGVLLRHRGILRMLDLHNGGDHSTDLQLPKERLWASVCAGGGSIFALEHGDDPSLWRFNSPAALHRVGEGVPAEEKVKAAVGPNIEPVILPAGSVVA